MGACVDDASQIGIVHESTLLAKPAGSFLPVNTVFRLGFRFRLVSHRREGRSGFWGGAGLKATRVGDPAGRCGTTGGHCWPLKGLGFLVGR